MTNATLVTLAHVALVTTGEAADEVGVRPGTVRQWAHTRHLEPVDRTRTGRPLYALTDVWDAELKARATRRGRPRLDASPGYL